LNRPSMLQGAIVGMTVCRLWISQGAAAAPGTVKHCERVTYFASFASQLCRFAAASYLCELVMLAVPERAPAPALYDHLVSSLDAIGRARQPVAVAIASELGALSLLGLTPTFDRCAECGKGEIAAPARFVVESGGVVCPACLSKKDVGPGGRTVVKLAAGTLAFAKTALDKPVGSLCNARVSSGLGKELMRLLLLYKHHHLQIELRSARLLQGCLRRDTR